MHRGIATTSSRQVGAQARHDDRLRGSSGRSSARPTPISATMTVSSVTCSITARLSWGSSGRPSGKRRQPEEQTDAHQDHRRRHRPPAEELGQDDGEEKGAAGHEVDEVGGHACFLPHRPERMAAAYAGLRTRTQNTDHPESRVNSSSAATPPHELPCPSRGGLQTATTPRPGMTATMPPPMPLLAGRPTR